MNDREQMRIVVRQFSELIRNHTEKTSGYERRIDAAERLLGDELFYLFAQITKMPQDEVEDNTASSGETI